MSASKRQRTRGRDTKNVPDILFSTTCVFINDKWMDQYRQDCRNMDSSDMYRTYYAKMRTKPWVAIDYIKYIKGKLDLNNLDDSIIYFTYANLDVVPNDKDIYKLAMSQIYDKCEEIKMRTNITINFITSVLKIKKYI